MAAASSRSISRWSWNLSKTSAPSSTLPPVFGLSHVDDVVVPAVPHTMLSPSSAVPQTMLSSAGGAPHDVVGVCPCPRRCCRRRAVPQTMLSDVVESVPQTMLSPSDRRCPTRCCRRRRRVPHTMLSPSDGAPDDVVAVSPPQSCPTRCCRRCRAPDDVVVVTCGAPDDVVVVRRCPRRCCRRCWSWRLPTRRSRGRRWRWDSAAASEAVVAPDDLPAPAWLRSALLIALPSRRTAPGARRRAC